MINENSSMADIALEVKDATFNAMQVNSAIKASVKQLDDTITNIKLSEVPEFIDNYPVSKPEIKDGYVGYAVDTSDNEYDVTNRFYKYTYPPAQEEFFQYNGQFAMPENFSTIEMFSDSINVQVAGYTLVYSTPDGKEFKRVTIPYTPVYTFMFHGYYSGYEDMYMVSRTASTIDSSYLIDCYNSQGVLSKSIYLKAKYSYYYDFTFDGEYFYSISRHTGSSDRYIDKYDSEGTYINSVLVPSDIIPKHVVVTTNYVMCFDDSSISKRKLYDKNLVFVSELTSSAPYSRTYNQTVSLFGLDHVYIRFGDYVMLFDLMNKTSNLIESGSNNTRISYFNSNCLMIKNTSFYKLDYKGNKFDIVKPKSPVNLTGLASDGSMIMGFAGAYGYSYSDFAEQELACLAQKRG
jgi:hypothetical protein